MHISWQFLGWFKKAQGYTLIELMVATLIISILSMLAIPPLQHWVELSHAKVVQKNLHNILYEARSLALTHAEIVTVCKLESNVCAKEFGFPITSFVDENRNSQLDSNENIVRYLDMDTSENIHINWNRGSYLRFWPSGGTGALTGSISYCHQFQSQHNFRMVVARTGRIRVDKEETRCSLI